MTLGPLGRELREPLPRDGFEAVRGGDLGRPLGLLLMLPWLNSLIKQALCFQLFVARGCQQHLRINAQGHPAFLIHEAVPEAPELRAIGIDLEIQAFLVKKLVSLLAWLCVSYRSVGQRHLGPPYPEILEMAPK